MVYTKVFVRSALKDKRLQLFAQPICSYVQGEDAPRFEVTSGIFSAHENCIVPAEKWIDAVSRDAEAMQALDFNTLQQVLKLKLRTQFWLNVSPLSLQDEHWVNRAVRTIRNSGVAPQNLVFEVIEQVPIENILPACETLRELGCGLVLDDFGSGYSVIDELVNLPLTALKFDKELCQRVTEVRGAMLLEAYTGISRMMGLHVVAEGVENENQLTWLRHLGVHMFQGYLFGGPSPIDDSPPSRRLPVWPSFACKPPAGDYAAPSA
ncbi:MAG: EAL domain-containing protein [Cyanobacteria bacterium P01_C01_bin.69]